MRDLASTSKLTVTVIPTKTHRNLTYVKGQLLPLILKLFGKRVVKLSIQRIVRSGS